MRSNIRTAKISDASLLARIHGACFAEKWDRTAFQKFLSDRAVFAFLAGDRDWQSLVLARIAADETEILTLATLSRARRKGLARLLVQRAAANAHARGAKNIFLEVSAGNAPARSLYASLGFSEAGLRRGYYAHLDGADADALTLHAALPLP
ncbi:MAG: GNAT family N-acetyltransferase [Alphaproteobacteria bacterium]